LAKPTVVSLFSGALGLDLGMEHAGFDVRVAVECNRFAAETIRRNRPELPLLQRRIEDLSTREILTAAGLAKGVVTVVTGGPSCQAFSTAGQRGSIGDPRGVMFREFLRVVREARPRFFIMENVRGVLSAAVKHRPLNRRGPGYAAIAPEEELGSALRLILGELKALRYYVTFDVVNAADFGVPQTRERVLFIGSRDGEPVQIPRRTHAKVPTGDRLAWVTLREALKDLDDPAPVITEFCASKKRFLQLVPTGGNWRDLPPDLQREALGAAFVSWGGRVGFFRRLSWDKPAPALTTRPDSKATMFCHPTELRPLSVAEYARVQGFPDGWTFGGGPPQRYLQIGNAVPVRLGTAAGTALLEAMRRRRRVPVGAVVCARDELLARLANRPATVLNPSRMRRYGAYKTARKWMGGAKRSGILELVSNDASAVKAATTTRRRRIPKANAGARPRNAEAKKARAPRP
jgi:DNA (cytosine-5)-methyltransferase 1